MLQAKQLTFADLEFNVQTDKEHFTPKQSMKGCSQEEIDNFCDAVKEVLEKADGAWGWCCVKVTGVLKDDIKFNNVECLGCCSYLSEADFMTPGGYYDDMCKTVLISVQWQLDLHVRLINESIEKGTIYVV